MQNLNVKKFAIASLAAFAVVFVFEWLLHGVLLKSTYEATAHLWRKHDEMVCWAMIAGQLMMPFVAAFIFTKGYEGKGIGEGLRFGLLLGLLFVPGSLMMYAVMPIPVTLLAAWAVGGIVEMVLVGCTIAALYKAK